VSFDVQAVRAQFPILDQEVWGRSLVYLDNAATTHKPLAVLEAVDAYYRHDNSNVHRGVHALSQRATEAYEAGRDAVRAYLNAPASREIVFTRGTTEAINLVASSWGGDHVGPDDEILLTAMEHHSNIVPWQLLAGRTGARLRVARVDERGVLDLDHWASLVGPRTRIAAAVHVSNALGTVNPIREMVRIAHDRGVPVLVDGAQAVPHGLVDVQDLGCDFYALSGHKAYGPTGIGALWGRHELLDAMKPYQGGGEMILSVTFEETVYARVPTRFEAGTPHIAGGVGLGAALRWLSALGPDRVAAHEADLLAYATRQLQGIDRVRIVGEAPHKAAVLSFVIDGIHPHDVGTILDREGVAVRTGHHCAQPVLECMGLNATTRASFAAYNTRDDVDRLVAGIHRVIEVLG